VEQIVAILKQAEVGKPVGKLIGQMGVSKRTLYRWKRKYGGLKAHQVQELEHLREENARLKRIVRTLAPDKAMVRRLYQEEGVGLKRGPKRRRRAAQRPRKQIRATQANQAWSGLIPIFETNG
jgi:putative transposase